MGKFARDLIESMQEAAKRAAGKKVRGLRVSKMELPDVRVIRLSLKMSQHHFAAASHIPLPTLKTWDREGACPMRRRRPICWQSSGVRRKSWKPSRGHEGLTEKAAA